MTDSQFNQKNGGENSAPAQSGERFVQQLTENQNRVYGYIYSLLGDHSRASDVLQETNLVLWRKNEEFREGADFIPWAFSIARFQVLAYLRDKKRDRCLLDEELVSAIAETAEVEASKFEEVRIALRKCMTHLSETNRELLRQRYFGGQSIKTLATSLDRGESAIKVALMRIRKTLATCIESETKQA